MAKQWLVNILHDKNLRHSDVAAKANINRAYFTQIVNCRRRPSPDVAKRIATVLGFPDEWYRLLEIKADGVSAAEK